MSVYSFLKDELHKWRKIYLVVVQAKTDHFISCRYIDPTGNSNSGTIILCMGISDREFQRSFCPINSRRSNQQKMNLSSFNSWNSEIGEHLIATIRNGNLKHYFLATKSHTERHHNMLLKLSSQLSVCSLCAIWKCTLIHLSVYIDVRNGNVYPIWHVPFRFNPRRDLWRNETRNNSNSDLHWRKWNKSD